jgi:hypothetical protein
MEPKTLLRSFWQLINVVRIAGLHTLSLFFISYSVGLYAMATGVRGCPPRPEYNNWYLWLLAALGVGSLIVSLYYIFRPSVWLQTIAKQIALSPTNINLPFFSTHPLYVFIDALFFIPAIALFEGGRGETMCQLNKEWAMGWSLLILAFLLPLIRVLSWYLLNRKIEAMTIRPPWLPIVYWYILMLPLFIFLTYTYMDKRVLPRLRVPVVNEKTFKGGFEKHPEFAGKIVRVQGKLTREIAKCGLFGKDPEKVPYPYGTVLLDMGKRNGQIMVQAKKPSQVETLEIEARNKKGKVFEAFGRLTKLPNPEKRLICGIGKADSGQKGGLTLLEIEMPE